MGADGTSAIQSAIQFEIQAAIQAAIPAHVSSLRNHRFML